MYREFRATFEQELRCRLKSIQLESTARTGIPCLGDAIYDFVLTNGKRIRPTLFLLTYFGYAKKPNPEIIKVAIALELLHSFALIHDDIVDDSALRRGCKSLHLKLSGVGENTLNKSQFGKDLAMLAGDVLYTFAIETFVSMKEEPQRKEKALKELLKTAASTGSGVFLELFTRRGSMDRIDQNLIFKIYNLKTVGYTFACPLKLAAILAEVPVGEIELLDTFAQYLGYAYQIKDDIDDLNSFVDSIPDSLPMRPEEIRLTLPVWYLYKNASRETHFWLENFDNPSLEDLGKLKQLLISTGAFELAQMESNKFLIKAHASICNLQINSEGRNDMIECLGIFFGSDISKLQEAKT